MNLTVFIYKIRIPVVNKNKHTKNNVIVHNLILSIPNNCLLKCGIIVRYRSQNLSNTNFTMFFYLCYCFSFVGKNSTANSETLSK